MEVRKVIVIGSSYAVTIPKKLLRVLRCSGGDYIELFLADAGTLVIRKHKLSERRIYDGRLGQTGAKYPSKD